MPAARFPNGTIAAIARGSAPPSRRKFPRGSRALQATKAWGVRHLLGRLELGSVLPLACQERWRFMISNHPFWTYDWVGPECRGRRERHTALLRKTADLSVRGAGGGAGSRLS